MVICVQLKKEAKPSRHIVILKVKLFNMSEKKLVESRSPSPPGSLNQDVAKLLEIEAEIREINIDPKIIDLIVNHQKSLGIFLENAGYNWSFIYKAFEEAMAKLQSEKPNPMKM